ARLRDHVLAALGIGKGTLAIEHPRAGDAIAATYLLRLVEHDAVIPRPSSFDFWLRAEGSAECVAHLRVIACQVDGNAGETKEADSVGGRQRVDELRCRLERRFLLACADALQIEGEDDDAAGLCTA